MVKLQFPVSLLLPDFSLLFWGWSLQMPTIDPPPLPVWAWATWFLCSGASDKSPGLQPGEPLGEERQALLYLIKSHPSL